MKHSILFRRTFFILSSILFCSVCVRAGNRSGVVAEQFLKIPTDARIVGMGNSMVAIAEGVASLSYNPSGLTSIPEIGRAHV